MSKLDKAMVGHDEIVGDPRLAELDFRDVLLHIATLAWCARWRKDGHVESVAQLRLAMPRHPDPEAGAATLTAAEVWTIEGDGWRLPWKGQITAARADRREAGNRERWDRYQDRQERHRNGDHGACSPKNCAALRAHANGVDNGVANATTDRTVSYRSEALASKSEGTRRRAPSAQQASPAGAARPLPPPGVEGPGDRLLVRPGQYEPLSPDQQRDIDQAWAERQLSLRKASTDDRRYAQALLDHHGVTVHLDCADYEGHRDYHRKLPTGWTCDVCEPPAEASA